MDEDLIRERDSILDLLTSSGWNITIDSARNENINGDCCMIFYTQHEVDPPINFWIELRKL